jgi:phosphoribosyl 1,2-cyclic phosphate phosphodiesterase
MKVTILGSGSSHGVPAAGNYWGACDPSEPRNNRTRASVMVQSGATTVVVDAGYDLRTQLNRHDVKQVDALLVSHAHSDHVNGIDDLRVISYHRGASIDLFTDSETHGLIAARWPYMFADTDDGIYKSFVKGHVIGHYDALRIGDVNVQCFEQDHGTCLSVGYRFGSFAYCPDVVRLNERSLEILKGVDTWVVDAHGYHREHLSTHANLKMVHEWVDIIKPRMTYLTVLSGQMDYRTLCEELPAHVRPCWDGMELEF